MTFVVKTRGARGPMLAEYLCPEHGRFEAVVERDDEDGDPPPWKWCHFHDAPEPDTCFEECELVISAPRIGQPMFVSAHRGKNDEKPHPMVLSTEALADGKVTYSEFKKQREAMWRAHDADNDPDRPKKVYSR